MSYRDYSYARRVYQENCRVLQPGSTPQSAPQPRSDFAQVKTDDGLVTTKLCPNCKRVPVNKYECDCMAQPIWTKLDLAEEIIRMRGRDPADHPSLVSNMAKAWTWGELAEQFISEIALQRAAAEEQARG